ncbi:MAG: YveK family protein [Enterococcus sp.]
MEKVYQDDDEIEIDLRELLFEMKKKIWFIIAGLLIGAAITGAYSKFLITPQYKSEAKLYVLSKETTLTSLADLQIGSQLTQDYKILVGSRPVLQGVVDHMKLDMTYRKLEKKLTIDNPNNTRILTLTIKDPNPYLAKSIVDEVANTASDYIGEIMEMVPPKLIEDGEVASEKASPNVLKNTIIGGILGLLLVCGIIVVRVILNDTVKSEEDVSKYLDLPVLAVIPKKDGNEDRKKGQGKLKKSRSTGRGAKAPEGPVPDKRAALTEKEGERTDA